MRIYRKNRTLVVWREYCSEPKAPWRTLLIKASKDQSTAFQNLHEGLLVHQDSGYEIEDNNWKTNTIVPTGVKNDLLNSNGNDNRPVANTQDKSDTETRTDLLESLTQAFVPTERKSPATIC